MLDHIELALEFARVYSVPWFTRFTHNQRITQAKRVCTVLVNVVEPVRGLEGENRSARLHCVQAVGELAPFYADHRSRSGKATE